MATNALAARLGHGAFSCLFLNPPYDYDEEERRLEHAFLTEVTRALCPGGLLIFVVPQRRLTVSARYLAAHYTQLRCFRFPTPEYDGFHQVVLFGVKREAAMADPQSKERLEQWSEPGECPELPEAGSRAPLYELPPLPDAPVLFAWMFFDPLGKYLVKSLRPCTYAPSLLTLL